MDELSIGIRKIQIGNWLKTNFSLPMHRNCLKEIIKVINHEALHRKIYLKFKIENKAVLLLDKTDERFLWVNGRCYGNFDIYNIITFLRFVFIEAIQSFYDIIYDCFNSPFFRIFYRIRFFIFKIMKGSEGK